MPLALWGRFRRAGVLLNVARKYSQLPSRDGATRSRCPDDCESKAIVEEAFVPLDAHRTWTRLQVDLQGAAVARIQFCGLPNKLDDSRGTLLIERDATDAGVAGNIHYFQSVVGRLELNVSDATMQRIFDYLNQPVACGGLVAIGIGPFGTQDRFLEFRSPARVNVDGEQFGVIIRVVR